LVPVVGVETSQFMTTRETARFEPKFCGMSGKPNPALKANSNNKQSDVKSDVHEQGAAAPAGQRLRII
jgi:hypothetical protein